MKKLTFKIFVLLFICFFAIAAVLGIVMSISHALGSGDDDVSRPLVFLFELISVAGSLTLFAYLINRLFVKRIKRLNMAVNSVAKGDYDIVLEDSGKDELSILTADFNTMTKELKSTEYLNREFVRNFSHELKTPVSSIKGYADLIKTSELSAEEIREYAGIISQESSRLFELSRQMLYLSAVEAKTIIKKDEKFKPGEQIRSIILLMQKEWHEKKIEIDVDMDEFEAVGNEELTYLIWQNLISNAVKYTGEGGKIEIQLNRSTDKLLFKIMDTGKGIPEKDQPFIFNPFYTTDKSRSGKSSGLGLVIVKTILEKLGGSIRFESEEGKGTTFFIQL